MQTFTIKHWRTGEIICEGDAESFKEFVEMNKGNLKGANLKGANLKGAYLKGAYLKGGNLEWANFEGANLKGAYLEGAFLKGAYLKEANLEGAYLKGANLEWANLEDSTISMYSKRNISIKLLDPNIEKQDVRKIKIVIGCKTKTISEWDKWFASKEEYETKRGTLEFRKIEAMYEAYKSYIMTVWGDK